MRFLRRLVSPGFPLVAALFLAPVASAQKAQSLADVLAAGATRSIGATNINGNNNFSANNSRIEINDLRVLRSAMAPVVNELKRISQLASAPPTSVDTDEVIEKIRALEANSSMRGGALVAFQKYKALAEKGNARARIEYGRMLLDVGNEEASKAVWSQFSLAVSDGNLDATTWLGWMHEVGKAPLSSIRVAANYYESSARSGDAWAAHRLGGILARGAPDVQRDEQQALKWFRVSANGYYTAGMIDAARLMLSGREVPRNVADATHLLSLASRLGDKDADFLLGLHYSTGEFVGKNIQLALKHYERAAALNHAASQNNLAVLISGSEGVALDIPRAISLLASSHSQGVVEATSNLAHRYWQGLGVNKDQAYAAKLMMDAAQRGYSPAMMSLAQMYELGEGVQRDLTTAVRWYETAANANEQLAKVRLFYLYGEGLGVSKNVEKAEQILRNAVVNGSVDAKHELAIAIRRKLIAPKQGESEATLLREAADAGGLLSRAVLGARLIDGDGMSPDPSRGMQLLEETALQGVEFAKNALAWHVAFPTVGTNLRSDFQRAVKILSTAKVRSTYHIFVLSNVCFVGQKLISKADLEECFVRLEEGRLNNDDEARTNASVGVALLSAFSSFDSMKSLGLRFEPKNQIELLWRLHRASEAGNGEASIALLFLYLTKKTDDSQMEALRPVFERAARQVSFFQPLARLILMAFEKKEFDQGVIAKWIATATSDENVWVDILVTSQNESAPAVASAYLRARAIQGAAHAPLLLCALFEKAKVVPTSASELATCVPIETGNK